MSYPGWNRNYQNQSQRQYVSTTMSMSTTSPAAVTEIVSTTTEVTNIQGEPLSRLVIALIVVIVLLSIIIIVLVCCHLLRRKTIAGSQNRSKPLSDYERGYVTPNDVRQSPGVLEKQKNVCVYCRKMISEGRSPEKENDAPDYIYLQDNPIEPIPEVIYPDTLTDTKQKANNDTYPLYHTIDTPTGNDPQTQSDEKTHNRDSSSTNVYQVVEPDSTASKT